MYRPVLLPDNTTEQRQRRETCSFPGVDREDAPEAESALTRKKAIPLASLHRVRNVYALTPLTVNEARCNVGMTARVILVTRNLGGTTKRCMPFRPFLG